MTATEELRRMLDERGVEWGNIRNDGSESDYLTEWQFEDNQGKAIAIEWAVGSGLSVETHRYHLTPEQAIAATLGPGTCYAIDTGCATAFCSVCGAEFMGSIMTNEPPDYVKPLACCPECGRRIIKSNGKADD